ncbi:hypothetical protein B0T14DRAFT_70168 [Immersiella caudata]|uniref:Uncharacterized protein n=1 Tax=Immersiella caudata TaxID=314043 RepID=A0AA39XGC7_9PEZI|nr:hypothetical protein B0T14DRAFT_70168 [Immersiella caudata]
MFEGTPRFFSPSLRVVTVTSTRTGNILSLGSHCCTWVRDEETADALSGCPAPAPGPNFRRGLGRVGSFSREHPDRLGRSTGHLPEHSPRRRRAHFPTRLLCSLGCGPAASCSCA